MKDCNVKDVNATTLNSVDVNIVYKDVVLLSDIFIPSTVRFGNLIVDSIDTVSLSGRDVDDYLQTNADLTFSGKLTVGGDLLILGDVTVGSLIDNMVMSQSNLLLQQNDQQLNCKSNSKTPPLFSFYNLSIFLQGLFKRKNSERKKLKLIRSMELRLTILMISSLKSIVSLILLRLKKILLFQRWIEVEIRSTNFIFGKMQMITTDYPMVCAYCSLFNNKSC